MTGFKKRLASTALATAMTLTALPVSVFFVSTGAAAEGSERICVCAGNKVHA